VILAVDAFNLAADRRGMGRYVRSSLSGMRALGQREVRLVVRDGRKGKTLEREFDLPVIEPRELRSHAVDAVWYPWNGMRFAPHAPAIVTMYDPFAFTFAAKSFIARRREQGPIRRAVREAAAIVTISEWSASELQRLFAIDPHRIAIVPPALESFWHPVPAPHESEYVLFVAGPDERKNARLLFEAFDRAFAGERTELIVAGDLNARDGAAFEKLRARKRHVKPSDEELRTLYSGALALAVPSLAEGYGMPVLEAMACGAPVIASSASALPEACAGAALLVAPTDCAAWSAALQRIVTGAQLRAELRLAGLARVAAIDPLAPARRLLEIARKLPS
jgi:glycosyltransferase involved in cell wall biosynthesis